MKRTFLAAVLAAALTLTACGGAQSQSAAPPALTEYDTGMGLTLSMAEGFTESQADGVLFCYEGQTANVRFECETFAAMDALGVLETPAADLTTEEYAELIRSSYGIGNAVSADENGTVCLPYTMDIQGSSVSYYAFFTKGPDAFWTTTFMCLTDTAADQEENFRQWAATIQTGPAPILPEALTAEEQEDLLKVIDKIAPLDTFGRSLTPDDLTNAELLRLAYFVSGAQQYGIVGMSAESFRDIYIGKYFGARELQFGDMICSCGATLASYDPGTGKYSWDGRYHDYTAHYADVYNDYQDAWKQDGTYYVTMYKYFSDLKEQLPADTAAFYATYNDAKAQQNALFTAADEDAFRAALAALDDSRKVLYTYTFAKDAEDRFILTGYRIGA